MRASAIRLKSKDLENYEGERARRGRKLPRAFRRSNGCRWNKGAGSFAPLENIGLGPGGECRKSYASGSKK